MLTTSFTFLNNNYQKIKVYKELFELIPAQKLINGTYGGYFEI